MASKHLYLVAKAIYSEKTGEELNDISTSRIHEVCGLSRQTIVNWKASDVAVRKSKLDRFCLATGVSRELAESVIDLPWDVDVNQKEFCEAVKNRNFSYFKKLGFSLNFLPSQLIAAIEELSPNHLVKKLWEYRNHGDDFLSPVNRFTFFIGAARIIYQDLIDWIEAEPKDVKISIDYLTSILDNLEVPVQERALFLMRPEQEYQGIKKSLKEIRVKEAS